MIEYLAVIGAVAGMYEQNRGMKPGAALPYKGNCPPQIIRRPMRAACECRNCGAPVKAIELACSYCKSERTGKIHASE